MHEENVNLIYFMGIILKDILFILFVRFVDRFMWGNDIFNIILNFE